MTTLQEEKKQLRREMRMLRKQLSPTEKLRLDKQMALRFWESECYQKCRVLLSFLSLPDEPDTWRIVRQALADGISVCVPRCLPEHRLRFFALSADTPLETQLVQGAYGVYEPLENAPAANLKQDGVVCLTPGLAFDRKGGRLGYGGGYYDRFLAQHQKILKLGCAASIFLIEQVPIESTDCPLDGLLTENALEVWHG